jgi:hypothetical protein
MRRLPLLLRSRQRTRLRKKIDVKFAMTSFWDTHTRNGTVAPIPAAAIPSVAAVDPNTVVERLNVRERLLHHRILALPVEKPEGFPIRGRERRSR